MINEGTRSGKGILSYDFKKAKLGKVVGTRSGGAVLGGRVFLLKDGSMLQLAVRGSAHGLEGKGVSPDVEVPSHWNTPKVRIPK